MSNTALEFYRDGETYNIPVITAHYGMAIESERTLSRTGLLRGDELPAHLIGKLSDNTETLYSSVRRIQPRGADYCFEIGQIPSRNCRILGERTTLRAATYSSSLTGNIGNGFEVAVAAALQPDRSFAYVASPGMGLSSQLTAKEQRYFRKHGRLTYTDEDGKTKPLPIIEALSRALRLAEIMPTDLYSDSSGAAITSAYGAACGRNQIRTLHQNVRAGITDLRVQELVRGMLFTEAKQGVQHALQSSDALRVRKSTLDLTKRSLGDEYLSHGYQPRRSLSMIRSFAVGLALGPKAGDPLIKDLVDFVKNNPSADTLLTVGDNDVLAAHPNLNARMIEIISTVSRHNYGSGVITGAVIEGAPHSIQTHYPQFLGALATAAFR